jgi:hypothetical protein
MKRWWLLGVAALGVALGVLLIPRPDSGADVPDRAFVLPADDGPLPAGPDDPSGPIDPTGAPLGLHSGRKLGDAVDQASRAGANPYAAAAAAARDTPQAMAVARSLSGWMQTIRVLKPLLDTDPVVADLLAETEQLNKDLREMRRDPTGWDWADLERRQVDLMNRLRQTPFHDDTMETAFQQVEQNLADLHAGKFDKNPAPAAP